MAKWTDTGKMTAAQSIDIPPFWLLGALVLVWLSTRLFPALTVSFGATRFAGAVLCIAGVALMIWAVQSFRRHQTSVVPHQMPERIITSGPFRLSRNPIYLGDVLVLAGAVLWWGAWPAILLIPAFVFVLLRRFIAPEEARMKENFGTEFDAFAKKTRRWL